MLHAKAFKFCNSFTRYVQFYAQLGPTVAPGLHEALNK